MSSKTVDKTLIETGHVGMLHVTIQGVGELTIEAVGERLCFLASNVNSYLTRTVSEVNIRNHPWILVSYDREAGKLVVKKKEK